MQNRVSVAEKSILPQASPSALISNLFYCNVPDARTNIFSFNSAVADAVP